MNADRFANILGAIVTVALVTTLVGHTETKEVIKSFWSGFANAVGVATGAPGK